MDRAVLPPSCAYYPPYCGLQVSLKVDDPSLIGLPHVHVRHGFERAIYGIFSRERIAGDLAPEPHRLMRIWLTLHAEELRRDWQMLVVPDGCLEEARVGFPGRSPQSGQVPAGRGSGK